MDEEEEFIQNLTRAEEAPINGKVLCGLQAMCAMCYFLQA